jgi:hypothetical protein
VRFPIKFTNKDREDFQMELIQKLAYIERIICGKQYAFRNQNACRDCDFLALCVAGDKTKYKVKGLFDHHR